MKRQLDGIIDSMDVSLSKLQEIVKERKAWCVAVHGVKRVGHELATEQQDHCGKALFSKDCHKNIPHPTCCCAQQFCHCPINFCCCLVTKSCLTLLTPWTATHQASLFFTISQSLLKLMSIESMMPSNHLTLCCSLLLLPSMRT